MLRTPRRYLLPEAPFATPDRKKRRLDRHGAMTGGPTPRVSRALLMSPEVLEDCGLDELEVGLWKVSNGWKSLEQSSPTSCRLLRNEPSRSYYIYCIYLYILYPNTVLPPTYPYSLI